MNAVKILLLILIPFYAFTYLLLVSTIHWKVCPTYDMPSLLCHFILSSSVLFQLPWIYPCPPLIPVLDFSLSSYLLLQGPLSLVSTIEELLERKGSSSGLEIREYGRRDSSRWPCGTLYPQKLALTFPTSGGCSVGIVRSWTQATDLSFF
jgi:hypothetical protein